jgi:hypothetical protein
MRWSEDDYARYLRRGQPAPVSEAAFMQAVVKLARQQQYLVYHTYTSKRSPEGFPDLICARAGSPLLAIETKTDTGQPTAAQAAWLEALGGCTGVVAEVWRPAQLQEIVGRLRGEAGLA